MPNETVSHIGMLAGGADHIVELLGIESLSHEDQALLVERFSDIVLKRLLLRVPAEHVEEMRRALLSDDSTPDSFFEGLERSIPDLNAAVREDLEKTVADFRE